MQQNLYMLHVLAARGKFVLLQVMFIAIQFNSDNFLTFSLIYYTSQCSRNFQQPDLFKTSLK